MVIGSWLLLLIAAALSVIPLIPPAPPAEQDPAAFDISRVFEHIEQIAQAPRPSGSPANQSARAYIVTQLEMLGLEPDIQVTETPNYYGSSPERVQIANVIAYIPGTAPTGAVALVGHYDTVPSTPGANDDASAVGILLEAARIVLAGQPLRNDVVLIFIDAEEPAPRYGSSAFFDKNAWAANIGFVINLETIGSGGPSLLVGMNGSGGWIINQYTRAAPYPVAFSFLTTTAELIGGNTSDFTTFRHQGIPGVEFAYLHGSPIYHTPADIPEHVSLRSLQQQGANTLGLAQQMGNLELGLSHQRPRTVFFTVGHSNVVRYPAAWNLPIALVAGAVLVAAGWRQRAWRLILRSVGATLVMMLGAALLAIMIWTVIAGQRSTMSIAESYLYLAALLVLTAGIGLVVARVFGRKLGENPDATGVVFIWWALGTLLALLAPGMSYLFIWPSLAAGLILLWRAFGTAGRRWQPLLSLPVLAVALVLLVPAIDIFYQLVQPRPGNPDSELPFLIAIPIVLLALLVELFRVFWIRSIPEPP